MKITKESIGIIAGSVIILGGISWLVVNSIRNKKIVKRLNFLIDNNITEQTYATNFFSSAYQTPLQGKNYIVMDRRETAKWVAALKSAFGNDVGIRIKDFRAGDNEDAIYSVFRALKDGVAVNQVAMAFTMNTVGATSLLDTLKGNLNQTEFAKVIEILDEKPPYGIKE